MCTVLQQHLNGLLDAPPPATPAPSAASGSRPDTRATQRRTASTSPVPMNRLHPVPTYSYLGDSPSLRKPIDPYDRKISSPAMHYHLPYPSAVGAVDAQRRGRKSGAGSTYLQQLRDRRSRSHSRSGMRMLVERMKSSSPRPRSPRMYNEEAIREAQYPDGRDPGEVQNGVERPIERDDFPAPPFAFAPSRRRHHSEPGSSMRSGSYESTPVISSDEEEDEVETVDEKLQRTEEVLQKMAAQGMMGKVFLQEIEVEKQRRKAAKHKRLDPRSAARTPAAKKEPHFRLRYDNPVNASPSRVADHLKPWDDDGILLESSLSRPRSAVTPFLPLQTPVQPRERATSPSNVIRPGYEGRQGARTLPPRFSPGLDVSDAGVGAYSTEGFSSNRSEDGLTGSSLGHRSPGYNIRVSSTYTQGLQAATPRSGGQFKRYVNIFKDIRNKRRMAQRLEILSPTIWFDSMAY